VAYKSLLPRVITGLLTLAVVLALLWVEPLKPAFALFIGLLVFLGLREYYNLVRGAGAEPETYAGVAAGTLVALSGYFADPRVTAAVLCAGVIVVTGAHVLRGRHSMAAIASSAFGVLYVGWFGAHFIFLQNDPAMGPGSTMTLLVAVVATDVGAYFVGGAFGTHKMAPKVSPNKSWEGAAGGLVLSILLLAVVYWLNDYLPWRPFPEWGITQYLVTAAVLSIAAQVGDLVESALKRDANIKDSGALFPGHGGVLDRCDGFLFAGPVLYYMVTPFNLFLPGY